MKVYLSPLAETKLIKLTEYLTLHWNLKVKKEFLAKLTGRIHQISSHPESCQQSSAFKGLYKCELPNKLHFTTEFIRGKKKLKLSLSSIHDSTPINLRNN